MNYRYYQSDEKGFILLATMIILILLSIIGLSMYQQIILSTQSIGTSRLKSLAQATSLDTLNFIENDYILANVNIPTTVCDTVENCAPPTSAEIDQAVKGTSGTFQEMPVPAGATETVIFFRIQNLGSGPRFSGRTLYRTTIITNIMGTVDVIESVYSAATI